METYEIIRQVGINGTDHFPGDKVKLEKHVAVSLLASGQITQVTQYDKTDRSVGLDSSDSKPVKKRAKKK